MYVVEFCNNRLTTVLPLPLPIAYHDTFILGSFFSNWLAPIETQFTSDVWMLYSVSGVWMLYFTSEVWMLYTTSDVWMLYH